MDGTKLLLFGNAVILFGGFTVMEESRPNPFDSPTYWILILGLGFAIAGLADFPLASEKQ